jgi:lambda repressor-like predicted transcriptional regulator
MTRTRWIAIAAAAIAVVLGGGAAVGAVGSSNPASDFLGDVAKRLGISQDRLEGAIEDAMIARIDAAVAAGDLTKKEGETLKERVRSGDIPPVVPGLVPGVGFGPPGHHGVFVPGRIAGADLLGRAADYLRIDEADVRDALRDGKSLAALAKAEGKSVDGLKNALRDELREDADRAVEDGVLTREEAERLVRKLSAAVDELVEQGALPALEFGRPGLGPVPLGPPKADILPPGPPPGAGLMKAVADYLDVDEAEIREAFGEGKSLADLAKDRGKSVDGLKRALRDAMREEANRAVEDGMLTKREADRLDEQFGAAVDKLVEGSRSYGFEFDFGGDGGKLEFRFRLGPEPSIPLPKGPEKPSVEVAPIPPQPA